MPAFTLHLWLQLVHQMRQNWSSQRLLITSWLIFSEKVQWREKEFVSKCNDWMIQSPSLYFNNEVLYCMDFFLISSTCIRKTYIPSSAWKRLNSSNSKECEAASANRSLQFVWDCIFKNHSFHWLMKNRCGKLRWPGTCSIQRGNLNS